MSGNSTALEKRERSLREQDGFQGPYISDEYVDLKSQQRLAPEYTDCKGVEGGFGIKPGLAYQLLNSGEIKGVSLKRRGQTRGKRLFEVASIRAFLKRQEEKGAN